MPSLSRIVPGVTFSDFRRKGCSGSETSTKFKKPSSRYVDIAAISEDGLTLMLMFSPGNEISFSKIGNKGSEMSMMANPVSSVVT